ncbi:MAG TPA: sulfatase [Chloroflexota bacterium]|nr:sulfatase [Chloroflexota bacterium]
MSNESPRAGQAPAGRPNILYLHSHDTGRYTQPFGHAIPMPNYQRLAEEGVLFRQCFSVGPTCSPSRAGLLTGQWAHSCGQFGLVNMGFELEHPERHIAWTLRNAGYTTALIGIQHVVRDPARTGYQEIQGGSRAAAEVAPRAVEFLRRQGERRGQGEQPFFLDAGIFETHRMRDRFPDPEPEVSPAEDPRYCLPPPPLPDTPETRADIAGYKASARILDAAVGQILDALDETGLAENTLVILTTDHGIAFPQMKCNLTDHGTGVLLIMRGPSGFTGGQVIDAMVQQIDLFPTVCDLAGIPRPGWLQGEALQPLVNGETQELHDAIYTEVNFHVAYEPQRAVRTTRWKYIRRYDEYGKLMLSNCDDGLSKDVWLDHDWANRPTDAEQLYDLVFDPQERNNLAGTPSLGSIQAELIDRLNRWMRQTQDPLLAGPVPVPEGARVAPPEQVSPGGGTRGRAT